MPVLISHSASTAESADTATGIATVLVSASATVSEAVILSKRPLVAPSLRSMSARRFARKRQDVLEAQVYAGIGGVFLTSFYPGNRFLNFTRNAADLAERVK